MIIKQYKYVQQEVGSKEFIELTETMYYFQPHIRRAIRIVPVMSTYYKEIYQKEEEIIDYNVTLVYNNFIDKIEFFNIGKTTIESRYYDKSTDIYSEFVKAWVDGDFLKRTKEQFEADLNDVLNKIK